MARQPFIHTADDFDLSVDEHGRPHFVDIRYLSRFGSSHGGNVIAFALVVACEFLALVITIVVGSIVAHLRLSNFTLAFVLLMPFSASLVAIFTIVFLYYRLRIALIISGAGTAVLLGIISGALLF